MARSTDSNTSRTYFRSERFFVVSNEWYFATREDGDRGPFDSPGQAQQALTQYLMDLGISVRASAWDVPGADH